jgi:hypothetical protein
MVVLQVGFPAGEVFRTSRQEKNRQTGKVRTIKLPQSEWLERKSPHLRILSDELAAAVRAKLNLAAQSVRADDPTVGLWEFLNADRWIIPAQPGEATSARPEITVPLEYARRGYPAPRCTFRPAFTRSSTRVKPATCRRTFLRGAACLVMMPESSLRNAVAAYSRSNRNGSFAPACTSTARPLVAGP